MLHRRSELLPVDAPGGGAGHTINPEEFYLSPPLSEKLTTGTLIKKDETLYVVMTPACDLVLRKSGKRNVDSVVLAEIVQEEKVYRELNANSSEQKRLKSNNHKNCFHRLPITEEVRGGYLDFRRLKTVPIDEDKLECGFECLKIRIAPSFIKDIVSRFSVFYARQGQPQVDPP